MRVRVDEGVRGLHDFVVHRGYIIMQRMEAVEESGHVTKTCPEVSLTGPACCSLVVLAVALVVPVSNECCPHQCKSRSSPQEKFLSLCPRGMIFDFAFSSRF